MQAEVARFKVQIPGLEDHIFSSGTVILLTGRPGLGKSAFAKQFCLEGLKAGDRIVAILTDTSADNFRKQVGFESPDLDVLDCLLEKPSGVHEISTRIQQLIAKTPNRPVRLVFDSLSTLGTMYNPGVLAPWLLDLRATLLKQPGKVLALVNYATGINPPSITRSLHPFADIILEMKMDESKEEPERQFRVFTARGVSHSTRWISFTITDSGVLYSTGSLLVDQAGTQRPISEGDRVLATVMFVDIVQSTEKAAIIGDRRWQEILKSYFGLVHRELDQFRGREINRAGDSLLAIFDSPERAVQCACSIRDAVHSIDLEVRVGLHAGEVQLKGNEIGGIAVHIGVRVTSQATPGEVLVSNTVKDLVAGSEIEFTDRGVHALKGVPGEWRLFAVVSDSSARARDGTR